jgi:hypothetical protein
MAKAVEAPPPYQPDPSMHLTLPANAADKLTGLQAGAEVEVTIRGTISGFSVNEDFASLDVKAEDCDITPAKTKRSTMTSAIDKSERKRRGYAA